MERKATAFIKFPNRLKKVRSGQFRTVCNFGPEKPGPCTKVQKLEGQRLKRESAADGGRRLFLEY